MDEVCTVLKGGNAFKSNLELERITEPGWIVQNLDICNIDNTHRSGCRSRYLIKGDFVGCLVDDDQEGRRQPMGLAG
mgnify:CR=1 FL=1